MAVVNRYTKTVDNVYKPRSLQELMVAPQYKRQKHDELDSAISEYETALAQQDALDIHTDALKEEQVKLYGNMIAQRDKLMEEGFSQNSKSDFMRFNKEYQQAIGPQGKIGQIQEAKTTMAAEREKYISNATKMGYSPEQAAVNWQNHAQTYKDQFASTGKITNIGALYAPKYHDVKKEMQELLKDAGYSLATLKNDLGTSTIIKGQDGTYVLTSKGYEKYGSNSKQIQAALDYMNNQINNVDSEVHQSLIHQGKTSEDAMDEIRGLKDVYLKTEHDFGSGSTISNYTPNKVEETFSRQGLVYAGNTYSPDIVNDSYSGIMDTIEELEGKDVRQRTQEDIVQLNQAREFKRRLDEEIARNPEFSDLKAVVDSAKNDMDALRDGTYQLNEYEQTALDAVLSNPNVVAPGEVETQWYNQLRSSKVSAYNEAVGNLEDATAGMRQDLKLRTNYYQVAPITSKQKTLDTNFKKALVGVLTDNTDALYQNSVINRVSDEEGNKHRELKEDDKKAISRMVAKANQGDIEVKSFTPQGENGLPGYRIRVKVDESYNLDGWKWGDDTIGGEGEWITLDLSFNKMDSPVIRDLNDFAIDYLATQGVDGAMVADKMIQNRVRDDYQGSTWGDLKSKGTFNTDPRLLSIFQSDVEREIMRQGFNPQEIDDANLSRIIQEIEERGVEINY